VQQHDQNTFALRYFTPDGEVPLCGHATISTFTVLRDEQNFPCGAYHAITQSGKLTVLIEPDRIWLQMPQGEILHTLSPEEAARVYAAYDLSPAEQPSDLPPAIVKAGLADILLPVNSKETLDLAKQNREAVIQLSRDFGLVGVHMFYCPPAGEIKAYCRNFAPLFGIDEESATGTSNAALSYYLFTQGCIANDHVNTIVQGETMGKQSRIYSKIANNGTIRIGGSAVISVRGTTAI
jgi:PhzF family phenazine biosynthesis protein